ncbi:DUF5818 domain-containing protein [Sphingobium phenoxybenzoativorans]|uniref:DUF5818 domain-containing protein n=1 Tax=Sphingobium phenoxybenzoativorans TaxID=1592790 RepID=UPI0009F2EE01|nr:DUF5818 domain-containing protein [Sphingobium phenoxybenzoativorans]
MGAANAHMELYGWLHRDEGGFILKADGGAVWRLVLHRVPVDHIEKRVRITGFDAGDGVIDAEGVSPA